MGVREILIERAINQGKEEAEIKASLEKKAVAANFKKKGVDIQIIADCTGLSIEEIKKIGN